MTTNPTKQPLPPTSPLAAALDAPLGGPAQATSQTKHVMDVAHELGESYRRSGLPHFVAVGVGGPPDAPVIHVYWARKPNPMREGGLTRRDGYPVEHHVSGRPRAAADEQPPPPPHVATPPARTLAEELRAAVRKLEPSTNPDICDSPYISGFNHAMLLIDSMLTKHPALQQPAPVAADGAGQGERRWGVLHVPHTGGEPVLYGRTTDDRGKAEDWAAFLYAARVVPVLVTVLADDGAPAGAEGTGKREQIIAQLADQVEAHGRLVRGELASLGQRLAAAESRAREAEALRAESAKIRDVVERLVNSPWGWQESVAECAAIDAEKAGNHGTAGVLRQCAKDGRAALGGGTPA